MRIELDRLMEPAPQRRRDVRRRRYDIPKSSKPTICHEAPRLSKTDINGSVLRFDRNSPIGRAMSGTKCRNGHRGPILWQCFPCISAALGSRSRSLGQSRCEDPALLIPRFKGCAYSEVLKHTRRAHALAVLHQFESTRAGPENPSAWRYSSLLPQRKKRRALGAQRRWRPP